MTTTDERTKESSDKINSDAFDEAAALHTTDDSGKPTSQTAEEGDDSEKAAQTDDSTRAADNAGDVSGDEDGNDDGGKVEGEAEQDYEALYKKEAQRNKSWEGRISKAERVARELHEENERLKASQSTDAGTDNAADQTAGDQNVLTPEDKQALEELATDYPLIAKALNAATKKVVKPDDGKVVERVAKIEQRIQKQSEAELDAHFQALETAYPNYRETFVESGELDGWIESLPYKDAVRYQQIKERGNTQAVLGMFDEFAESTGKKPKAEDRETNNQPTTKDKRLESMTAVRRHSGKPAVGGGSPSKEDFDGAFDRGAASHQR